MIILVGGEKGGAGKSCLAQNLAVYLQQSQRDVLLLDADPQGTTTDWVKERDENDELNNIPSVQASGNIRSVLKDLDKRYQDIIIDAVIGFKYDFFDNIVCTGNNSPFNDIA